MIVQKFDRTCVRTIKLDDFIQCCVMIRSLTEAFKQKDRNATGVIKIHFEEVRFYSIQEEHMGVNVYFNSYLFFL